MANKILATSQVTLIDLNDQVSLSSYINSTVPQMQLLSNTGTYVPSWTLVNPVTLTAELFKLGYSSDSIINSSDVKAVRWYYKLATQTAYTPITSTSGAFELIGSSPKFTQLKIVNNMMTKDNPGMTIKCEIDYQESWMPVHTQKTEMPFTLSSQGDDGNNGKDAYTVILTNENQSIVCDANGNPVQGQLGSTGKARTKILAYKGTQALEAVDTVNQLGSGKFTVSINSFDGGGSLSRVSGSYDEYYLSGSISDSGFFDFTITFENQSNATATKRFTYAKVKPGANPIIATLTNESQVIATDKDGNNGNFSICQSAIQLYSGATIVTQNVTYSIKEKSPSITATMNSSGLVTVSNMTTDTGYIDLCARYNNQDYVKRFSISKSRAGNGENATSYWMIAPAAIARDVNKNYQPNKITLKGMYQNGNSSAEEYAGKFTIEESTDGATWTRIYASPTNETTVNYTPTNKNVKLFRANMYVASSTVSLEAKATPIILDTQEIVVVEDGIDGAPAKVLDIVGENNFRISESGDVTPSQIELNAVVQNIASTIQWQYYNGTSWVNLATGNKITVTTDTTGWSNNLLRLKAYCTSDAAVYDTFSIIKVTDGKNGTNGTNGNDGVSAVNLSIWGPKGTVIHNGNATSVALEALMYQGATDITKSDNVKYTWKKLMPNGSTEVLKAQTTGSTGYKVDVPADAIPVSLPVICEAVFDDKTYKAVITVEDKMDPIQVDVISTNGETFKKGQNNETYLYPKLIRNGEELDIVTMYDNVPAVSSHKAGDIIYVKADKKYRQLVGSSWSILNEAPSIANGKSKFDYIWTKYTSAGVPSEFGRGKIMYVSSANVSERASFVVSVEG